MLLCILAREPGKMTRLAGNAKSKVRTGFTVVELLVVIGAVATLFSLLIGSAVRSRGEAKRLQCLSTIRQNHVLFSVYAADYCDSLPDAGRRRRNFPMPDGTYARLGGSAGFTQGTWNLAFPGEWDGHAWPQRWQCPLRPAYTGAPRSQFVPAATDPYAIPFSSYWMSSALWLKPEPDYTLVARSVTQVNKMGDVRMPSKKVLLVEAPSYCSGADPFLQYLRSPEVLPLPTRLVRAVFVDGSARHFDRCNPEATGTGWMLATRHGIHGRDEP